MAELILHPDGRVSVLLGNDEPTVLRRPKLREYRALRELVTQHGEEMRQIALDRASNTEGALSADEVNVRAECMAETLWRTIDTTLHESGPAPAEDVEEWPTWVLYDGKAQGSVFEHWRSVPLAPGRAGTNG